MTLNQIRALLKESEETGRPIQYKYLGQHWIVLSEEVSFGGPSSDYRIAPPEPPKPREYWIHKLSTVAGADSHLDDQLGRDSRYIRVREIP